MMKTRRWIAFMAACLATASGAAFAHSGGLNADGCHNDRKNGGYHCHRGPNAQRAPVKPVNAPRHNLTDYGRPAPAKNGTFRNCSEARAAGAAPVRRGDPGYGSHLDRDGDGVGCE